jgi:3-hydroxyacyl-[acyl-carrier-protein] dehydratase
MIAFFEIKSKDIQAELWKFNLALNPNHPVYKGHFPQKPIAPGAMLTEMVKELVEQELGRKLKMKEAKNIKFLNMMLPENASDVQLDLNVTQQDFISVKAEAKIKDEVYFKISAAFV